MKRTLIRLNTYLPSCRIMPIFHHLEAKDQWKQHRDDFFLSYPTLLKITHPIQTSLEALTIHVHYLRHKAANTTLASRQIPFLRKAAIQLLDQINDSDPLICHGPQPPALSPEMYKTSVYYVTTVLYAVHTLRSLFPIESLPWVDFLHTKQRKRLFKLLKYVLKEPRARGMNTGVGISIAGYEAVHGGDDEKDLVIRCLHTYQDLVLETCDLRETKFKKFWNSGKTEWEDCFTGDLYLET